ncbi:MAG: pseudouridine synthase [Candidatus Dependentiae bacterium]|nr:pseudouridine synthase [Candidatus Dependentiae bacterium]
MKKNNSTNFPKPKKTHKKSKFPVVTKFPKTSSFPKDSKFPKETDYSKTTKFPKVVRHPKHPYISEDEQGFKKDIYSNKPQSSKFNKPSKFTKPRGTTKPVKATNPTKPTKTPVASEAMSLSKYLALGGVGSRRKVTELIKEGFVTVNNKSVTEPGYKLLDKDIVRAKGELVKQEEKAYILLNKPKDYITTVSDEKGRRTVMDLIRLTKDVRVYPIGRLDRATTGLLLLTNDGELALKLAHPRYKISKVYLVELDKLLTSSNMRKLVEEGVELEDGKVVVDEIVFQPGDKKTVTVEIHSGKYRVVRRIFEAIGYEVRKLDRISYAGLTKQGLRVGQCRFLEPQEVAMLKKMGGIKE